MVSNTTDESIKKPADGMEQLSPTLPEYSLRPIDTWKTQDPAANSMPYDSMDYPKVCTTKLTETCIISGDISTHVYYRNGIFRIE